MYVYKLVLPESKRIIIYAINAGGINRAMYNYLIDLSM